MSFNEKKEKPHRVRKFVLFSRVVSFSSNIGKWFERWPTHFPAFSFQIVIFKFTEYGGAGWLFLFFSQSSLWFVKSDSRIFLPKLKEKWWEKWNLKMSWSISKNWELTEFLHHQRKIKFSISKPILDWLNGTRNNFVGLLNLWITENLQFFKKFSKWSDNVTMFKMKPKFSIWNIANCLRFICSITRWEIFVNKPMFVNKWKSRWKIKNVYIKFADFL